MKSSVFGLDKKGNSQGLLMCNSRRQLEFEQNSEFNKEKKKYKRIFISVMKITSFNWRNNLLSDE